MKRGDIVRRIRGWTPMRVLRTVGSQVEAVYCGQWNDCAVVYDWSDLTVVTDAVEEFAKCPDWGSRMSDNDRTQLMRQSVKKPNTKKHKASKEDTMPKLYQTKEETPRFGTYLTTNSVGKLLLEMKGMGGAVELFEKSDLEEVRPYTVAIVFVASPGTVYQYLSRKGDVEKGDIIMSDGGAMARVVDIDTKSDKATKNLRGRKVLTAAFGSTDDSAVDLIEDDEDDL